MTKTLILNRVLAVLVLFLFVNLLLAKEEQAKAKTSFMAPGKEPTPIFCNDKSGQVVSVGSECVNGEGSCKANPCNVDE